jgi:hypothetical protein
MSLADSILQTASIARWIWVAAMATHHIIFNPPVQGQGRTATKVSRRSEPAYSGAPSDLAKLALTTSTGCMEESLDQFDGPLLGVRRKKGEPVGHLLGFGERPIGHGQVPFEEPSARALGRQPSTPSRNPAFIPSSTSFYLPLITSSERGFQTVSMLRTSALCSGGEPVGAMPIPRSCTRRARNCRPRRLPAAPAFVSKSLLVGRPED